MESHPSKTAKGGAPGYVQVEFADGRYVMGYPRKYSDDTEEFGLFLEDAAWVSEHGELMRIPGAGILVTKASGITNVMFLDAESSVPDARDSQE